MKAKTKNKIWTGVLSIGLISYVGSKLFAINQLIDYCEIEDIFWRIPIQTITIVAEVHAMSFTRVTSLYRKILNRSLPPSQPQSLSQEPATPSNSLTKRKTANVLTAVISASAFINGVCPAILLTYLGTKTLLPSNLKKINVIMDGATLVMLLSNHISKWQKNYLRPNVS
jgi:hypothetical protein